MTSWGKGLVIKKQRVKGKIMLFYFYMVIIYSFNILLYLAKFVSSQKQNKSVLQIRKVCSLLYLSICIYHFDDCK